MVLAVVLATVDCAAHRAWNALHHRHGVEEHFAVAVRERPNLSPHVLHSHGEFGRYRFERGLRFHQRRGLSFIWVSVYAGGFVPSVCSDGALRAADEAKSAAES